MLFLKQTEHPIFPLQKRTRIKGRKKRQLAAAQPSVSSSANQAGSGMRAPALEPRIQTYNPSKSGPKIGRLSLESFQIYMMN